MFKNLINWSLSEHKELPWRVSRTLYGTLVSEIMLQQTTVQTVLNHFERFLIRFPNVYSLANATEEELTIQWKGLGYYRRARNLKKACTTIVEKYNGSIPLDYDELVSINGIGEYTANAVLAIGADLKALAIDANLERVISRLYGISIEKGPKLNKEIQLQFKEGAICSEIESIGARDFNEALMDLGRNFCRANRVYCEVCPMSENCIARQNGNPLELPKVTVKKTKESFNLKLLRVIVEKDEKFLTYKKKSNEWLSGQYEIPTFVLDCNDESFKQYEITQKNNFYYLLPMIKSAITKYSIENYILMVNESEFKSIFGHLYFEYRELSNSSNLSTTSLKCFEYMGYKKQEKR